MATDEPPYLTVGTEVSARYKGAFCEAKVKKVNRSVKCRVNFKNSLGNAILTCDLLKGDLQVGASVEAKHPDNGQYHDAVITKLHDYSQYTVVFDDGDVTTLRRTSLCLKSGKHFAESETLDQLPLTNPEHFGIPVVNIKTKRKRRSGYSLDERSSGDEATTSKIKKEGSPKEKKYLFKDIEADLGRVVCVDYGDKRKKDSWFPGLVVIPTVQEHVTINQKEDFLIRSFKDGKYYTVAKKDVKNFKKDIASKVEGAALKIAVEKAIQYIENAELPVHWDRDLLLNVEIDSQENESDTDTESSDDEPAEDKDRFIAQLYNFMDERSTPINKAPALGNRDLNLYKLFQIVQKMGGYNRVTNQTRWKNVYMKMGIPSPNSSSVLLLKQAYRKYLHGFEEIHKKLGYTMVGKESTRSGRSTRYIRNTPIKPAKKEIKIEEKETTPTSVPSNVEETQENETRRPSRNKSKEDKEESSPAKKLKVDGTLKKETRSNLNLKPPEKSKEEKSNNSRTKIKKEDNDKVDIKHNEIGNGKRNGRKKPSNEDGARANESIECDTEDHIKNGPVLIGDRVKVRYGNGNTQKIYEAKVREIQREERTINFLVHYTGWNMRYDEWVRSYHIVECTHEKTEGKQSSKKKSISAVNPKVVESFKGLKRGRSNTAPSITKGSKTKPTGSPSSKSASKSSTSKSIFNSASSNGKSPSRNLSAIGNITDDEPSVRSSRATRSEKKTTPAKSSPVTTLENRRKSRRESGIHAATDQIDSGQDSSDIELEVELPLRTRKRKDSDTNRKPISEPTKKLNTRSSQSKKPSTKTDKDEEKESACRKTSDEVSLQIEEDEIEVCDEKPKEDVEDDRVKVSNESKAPDEPRTDETKEEVKEVVVDISSTKSTSNNAKEDSKNDNIDEATDSLLSPPVLEVQVKRENQIKEENVPGQDYECSMKDVDVNEELSTSASMMSNDDGCRSFDAEELTMNKDIDSMKSHVSSDEFANTPKKIECNKEVLKVEGAAIVEDAFRKMAANLKKNLSTDILKMEPDNKAMLPKSSVSVVLDNLANLNCKKNFIFDEAEPHKAPADLDQSSTNDVSDEISSQNDAVQSEKDNVLIAKDEVHKNDDDSQDECEVKVVKGETPSGLKQKKKNKDSNKEHKSKKIKKKEKKGKLKVESDYADSISSKDLEDEEREINDRSKKKDKKNSLKSEEYFESSSPVSRDASPTRSAKKSKKKTKKERDRSADEGEKKVKKKKQKDEKSYDESEEEKFKTSKSKKKLLKSKSLLPVEAPVKGDDSHDDKETNCGISLLCDEDVLPASPLPSAETKVVSDADNNCLSGSSLAAVAPALAAELQHPSHLNVSAALSSSKAPLKLEQSTHTIAQSESVPDSSQLLVDNTPPTTPESSISTTSVVSSPSHECEPLEGSIASHENSINESPHSIPETSIPEPESKNLYIPEELEKIDKDSAKKRRKGNRRTRSISESSKVGSRAKVTSIKDSESSNASVDSKDKITAASFPNMPPKSSKFDFYVPLDEYTDGAKRIELLQEKMCELRKKYMALKAEVAQIDRRRKRARKKEREGGSSTVVATSPAVTVVECS